MERLVDLHLHSTCSDGVHSPTEVVRIASEAGLAGVALCDHDNIDGIDEAFEAGRRYGIDVLSGVELSVVWEDFQDVHLLGYGFDHHHAQLRRTLHEFQEFRRGRNDSIVERVNEKLATMGREPIAFERVQELAGGTIGRPHIAMALKEKGHVVDNEDAFQRFLIPCNVEKRYFPIGEAIELIHSAGGVTSLAHPPFITSERTAFLGLLEHFVSLGLEGVEAYNNGASVEDIHWYVGQARRRGLMVTGGSDFHGFEETAITLGKLRGQTGIPASCFEDIRQALARR